MCLAGLFSNLLAVIWEDDILPKLKILGCILLFLATPVILIFGGSAAFMLFDKCFRYLTHVWFGWY